MHPVCFHSLTMFLFIYPPNVTHLSSSNAPFDLDVWRARVQFNVHFHLTSIWIPLVANVGITSISKLPNFRYCWVQNCQNWASRNHLVDVKVENKTQSNHISNLISTNWSGNENDDNFWTGRQNKEQFTFSELPRKCGYFGVRIVHVAQKLTKRWIDSILMSNLIFYKLLDRD